MKLRQRGSAFFIIGGVLAVISSGDSSSILIIPGQIKILGGIALIAFGLSRLLLQHENNEEQNKNRKLILLIVSILTVGAIGYYYFQGSEHKKKSFAKSFGTFEIKLDNKTYLGEAIFEGDKVTLQIKKIPADIRIDGFNLYYKNVQIKRTSIEWVCALMSDLRVVRCSTDLDLPKDNFKMFVDKRAYTILYWLKEPLENIKISDISFTILTDKGKPSIKITEKK